jgi:hypothetical protein
VPIAPELARAIVDDYSHLSGFQMGRMWRKIRPHDTERPDLAAEEKEEAEVAARLAEHLSGVRCPPDYWATRADTDRRLLHEGAEPSVSGDELVQLQTRLIVFEGSPDGAAWRTMMHLSYKKRTRAEQAELDEFKRRYPTMPLKHYDFAYEGTRHMEEILREFRRDDGYTWHGNEDAIWKCVERCR